MSEHRPGGWVPTGGPAQGLVPPGDPLKAQHEPFRIEEVGTAFDDIRATIMHSIAIRCGQIPYIHPRLLEGIDVAARKIDREYTPGTEASERAARNRVLNGLPPLEDR